MDNASRRRRFGATLGASGAALRFLVTVLAANWEVVETSGSFSGDAATGAGCAVLMVWTGVGAGSAGKPPLILDLFAVPLVIPTKCINKFKGN